MKKDQKSSPMGAFYDWCFSMESIFVSLYTVEYKKV